MCNMLLKIESIPNVRHPNIVFRKSSRTFGTSEHRMNAMCSNIIHKNILVKIFCYICNMLLKIALLPNVIHPIVVFR